MKYKYVPVNMDPVLSANYSDAEMIVEVETKKILYGNWTHYPSHIGTDDLKKIVNALNSQEESAEAIKNAISFLERAKFTNEDRASAIQCLKLLYKAAKQE